MAGQAVRATLHARGEYDKVLVDITTYVYHYNVESSRAWSCAKLALLDALGCALETLTESDEARALIGPVVPGTTVRNGFRLPGTPYQLDILKGSFDLGSLIQYLDHNDAYPGFEWGHPSDNIGAILAVADWLSRSAKNGGQRPLTMEKVLLGLIKAYEIQGCFQVCNAFDQASLDHTFLVKIASTAIVSWLLGLTEIQAMDALSQAWMDNAPLRVFRHHPNTGPRKGWAAGDACMRAVHLAWLTRRGQPGAPTVLTTPHWGFRSTLLNDRELESPSPLGTQVVESIYFKIYEVDEYAASAIEAAVEISGEVKRRGLSVIDDIAHVHVRTHQAAILSSDKEGPFHNPANRNCCLQYTIAVVLIKGSMTESADYQGMSPWANDPCVEALRKKIDLIEEPQFTADYHDNNKRSASSSLTVTLKDGTNIDEVVREYPLGHPRREETPSFVKKKLKKNVEGWYGKGEKARNILGLETLKEELFRMMPVYCFVDRFAGE